MNYHRNNITPIDENEVFSERRAKVKRKGAKNAKNRKVFSEQTQRTPSYSLNTEASRLKPTHFQSLFVNFAPSWFKTLFHAYFT